jgi:hypothetical protein
VKCLTSAAMICEQEVRLLSGFLVDLKFGKVLGEKPDFCGDDLRARSQAFMSILSPARFWVKCLTSAAMICEQEVRLLCRS